MNKKNFFISMLALFISLVWVFEASALTNCRRCLASPYGLCLDEVLKGLGNVLKDGNDTYSIVGIYPIIVSVDGWINNGGNDGGIGQPFYTEN